ncbi:MAG TPA: methylamine dehydrogenase accessory protein MauD, partial [Steroidobacteraceae bacterium]|nr:methylamine dehydrogenase accessory protein MauD [Steroidobacteraceae bacterium]
MLHDALPYIVIVQLVVTLVLAILLFGVARQVGVLHERVAPMGAMTSDHGPAVGEGAPRIAAQTLDGESIELGGPSAEGRRRLLLFVSSSCPVCKKLLPIARSLVQAEPVDLILVGDGDRPEQRAMIGELGLAQFTYVDSPRVGLAYHVGKLPYAVLLDAEGVIRAKGLCNTREHLESLIVAEETGFGTIQDYFRAGARPQPAGAKVTAGV